MTSPAHILVVEDDYSIREALQDLLSQEGYEVGAAPNGAAALEQLRKGGSRPGLILLDLMMPVMDGKSFRRAQLLDAALAEIPVVLLSASADVADQARALGAAGFLKKPPTLEHILAAVEQHRRRDPPRA